MSWVIDLDWLVKVFLVSCRLGPLFVLTPVFGSSQIPVRVRVLLAVAFGTLLVSALEPAPSAQAIDFASLVLAAVVELLIGLALAFGLLAVFSAFQFAGRLLDLQIGFGAANLFDPVTRGHGPLIGTGLNMLAIVVFFALNGHHMVLRGVALSLQRIPPGHTPLRWVPEAVIAHFGVVFTYGLVLVAPAVFALLLLDVAFALLSRTMPQMNVFVVVMPLKVVVGLGMLALSMTHLMPVVRRLFETVPHYWDRVLAG